MLDPIDLYPESFHPVQTMLNKDCSGYAKHFTRTRRPPKYYFIDFGLSRRYDPLDTNPREVPIWGGDKEVPEFQNSNEPCNPFATDVFYIGNAIRKDFILVSLQQYSTLLDWLTDVIQRKRGFEFMKPLVADMIQADPSKRPNMDEVILRFDEIRLRLSGRKLRARPVDIDEDLFDRVARTTSHWTRRIVFFARGIPAIPYPPAS